MAKLTKKSHKRRRLLMGLSVFMSIALVSTGFAAWVISSSVTEEGEGNVQAGNISNKSLALEIDNAKSLGTFKFEPNRNDGSGRVRFEGGESTNYESLSVEVTGRITQNPEYLGELTIELVETDQFDVPLPKENSNLAKAAEAGFITLPECFYKQVKLNETGSEFFNVTDHSFKYTVEFGWGEVFHGINPGYFYDYKTNDGQDQTDSAIVKAAEDIDDETMIQTLVDLRNTIYGINESVEENATSSAAGPKYKVLVRATTN